MKKKKSQRRTPEEAAADVLKVLRSKADIDHNHWVSGIVGCTTCNIPDPDPSAWEMDARDIAAVYDVSMEAVEIGMAKAAAATKVAAAVVEQFPEIAEPEREDLDSLGEQGQFSNRLAGDVP